MNRVVSAWTVTMAAIAALALAASLNATDGSSGSGSGEQVLEVKLVDIAIEPKALEAEAGRPITIEVTNDGATTHNFAVSGHGKTEMLDSGESATLELGTLEAGTYEVICEVAGHANAGMKGTLVVSGSAGTAAGGSDEHRSVMDPKAMDASYLKGVESFPAKTEGMGGRLMRPKMDGDVKVYEMTADETEWEVAPGDFREAMAYNGVVPGPEIRVRQGDRIRVVLQNELEESTAMHFHGLNVPNDQDGVPGLTQEIIEPGQSHTYEFTVPNSGTHMYHSHMNGATQIPGGLLGALIVEGDDEPQVDVDTSMVLNDGPLGFTLNGKGFPATQPIAAKPGQTVRIRYMNEGLQGHPMHLHGMEQTVIAKDGWKLDNPYKADTIWVAPGERYDVLVTAREGLWAYHCHILSHAEGPEGMFGMVTVMAVQ